MTDAVGSHSNTHHKKVRFFAANKFSLGLFSFIYVAVIFLSLAAAILVPIIKGGKFRFGDFILLGIPAWILLAIVVAGLEGGKWFLYPHWFWTACKSVRTDRETDRVAFITGWWPFRSRRVFAVAEIAALVLASAAIGAFGGGDRFGLRVLDRYRREWKFFVGHKGESEVR